MEKNIQDEHFEAFVRQSFEDYEALPSPKMWDNIENELDKEDSNSRPVLWWWQGRPNGARIALLTVILLSIAGAVLRYNYIISPNVIVAKHRDTPLPPTQIISPTPVLKNAPENNNVNVVNGTYKIGEILTTKQTPNRRARLEKKKATLLPTALSPKQDALAYSALEKKPTPQQSPYFVNTPIIQPEKRQIEPLPEQSNAMAISSNIALHASMIAYDTSSVIQKEVAILPNINLAILDYPDKEVVFYKYISPFKKGQKRTYFGIHTMPIRHLDGASKTRINPNRPRFASRMQNTKPSLEIGLKAGGNFYSKWGWETGLSFRSTQRNAVHFPRFRFAQGILRSDTGNPSRNYDFNYNLDTYGGSADVTMRMEQVDNTSQIGPNEAVSLQVATIERVQLLRIPFSLTTSWGKGRVMGSVKSGLVGNYIAKNEIEIVERNSTSNRFRASNIYNLKKTNNGRFFLGYQFAAGLSYQWTTQCRLVMEPTFSGDFSRKTSAQTRLPGTVSIGMNVGVNWYW